MNELEAANKAIRNVHGNRDATLEEVKIDLEQLAELASELAEAIAADIKMQGEADQ